MTALLLLVLQSAPIAYGESLVARFHTFDLERCHVRAEPHRTGVRVRCALTLTARRAGPVRFLLSGDVHDLRAERDGRPVPAALEGGGFETVVRLLAPEAEGVPRLLVLPAVRAGERATFVLSYDWRPRGGIGLGRDGWMQTHIGSFWMPVMADERFDAVVEVITDGEAIAAGRKERIEGGWRFTSEVAAQVVPVVAGPFAVHREGPLELYVPDGLEVDARRVLADTAAALAKLESWFGPRETRDFRVVFDPRRRPLPSYCGGNFVVLARHARPDLMRPESWRSHIAHECAHAWWGHGVGMPVIGRGGNFLREGLAQWCGLAVADDPVLWKRHVAAYLATADLRRDERGILANEPTLRDATYLDPPRIAYWRGALLLRRLERRLGRDEFLARLRALYVDRRGRSVDLDEFAARFDAKELLAYGAETSRLPDVALEEVDPSGRAVVRLLDAGAPDGPIRCVVETAEGATSITANLKNGSATIEWKGEALRIEVDPERVWIDPVYENNVWKRKD